LRAVGSATGSRLTFQWKDDPAERTRLLYHADAPGKMDLPGFRLHPMTGDLRGFWSVTVRANWRIIWRYDGADAMDVELIDYH
jgi:toxin HigB-1